MLLIQDIHLRPWILFYYAAFIVIIGIPGWWYFTTIERSHIPSIQGELPNALQFILDLKITFYGNENGFGEEELQRGTLISLNDEVSVSVRGTKRATNPFISLTSLDGKSIPFD